MIVIVAMSAGIFGGKLANDVNIPGSEGQKAVDLLEARFPERSGDSTRPPSRGTAASSRAIPGRR